jgi:ribose 5-phosphate isomerase B
MPETVLLSSDHAGTALRLVAARAAAEAGFAVEDVGPAPGVRAEYPDEAARVGEAVAAGRARFGILVCGTGIGVSIAANKVKGIRAAHCGTEYEARMARTHNDANVLCMGERVIGAGLAEAVVRAFLAGAFEAGGRHAQRVARIGELDRR